MNGDAHAVSYPEFSRIMMMDPDYWDTLMLYVLKWTGMVKGKVGRGGTRFGVSLSHEEDTEDLKDFKEAVIQLIVRSSHGQGVFTLRLPFHIPRVLSQNTLGCNRILV